MMRHVDGWTIETYETRGCSLAQCITSPAGRGATARWIGHDGRLSQLRTDAGIEFGSCNLRLSEALVDRMIAAAEAYAEAQVAAEPEYSLTDI